VTTVLTRSLALAFSPGCAATANHRSRHRLSTPAPVTSIVASHNLHSSCLPSAHLYPLPLAAALQRWHRQFVPFPNPDPQLPPGICCQADFIRCLISRNRANHSSPLIVTHGRLLPACRCRCREGRSVQTNNLGKQKGDYPSFAFDHLIRVPGPPATSYHKAHSRRHRSGEGGNEGSLAALGCCSRPRRLHGLPTSSSSSELIRCGFTFGPFCHLGHRRERERQRTVG
jgi:hypothetical protein